MLLTWTDVARVSLLSFVWFVCFFHFFVVFANYENSCSRLVNCPFSNLLRSIFPFRFSATPILLIGINRIIIYSYSEINGEVADSKSSGGHGTKIILILGVNIGILVLAGCVGVTCYSKRANLQLYNKLPGTTTNDDAQYN